MSYKILDKFSLTLKLKGYPLTRAKKKLKIVQNEKNISDYQQSEKWKILNFHYKNNLHYRNFVGNKFPEKWKNVPVQTKSSIQAPIKDRFSDGFTKINTHIDNTSGSSGTPFYYAKDKFCHALCWAIIKDRFSWHSVYNGSDLQARFYGIPKGKMRSFKEKIKDFILNRIRFPVFDLSNEILDNFISKFYSNKFIYVNGYTSSLVIFAKYCIEKKIIIKEICPTLKSVFTTSEVCDDIDKKTLEHGFGVPVVNEYGASELDIIGFEDRDGDWLVNYETLFVEILNSNNQAVKPGKQGRVVITSLYNKAMPFIRYDIGDLAILKKHKKSGYQVLKRVLGRTNDIVLLPSGKKSAGLTFYYISKKLLESGGFMREFIIIQKKLNHFHYQYVANRLISNEEKKGVQDAMELYLEKGLKITFERKNKIKRNKSGKLKQFYSEINE